MKAEEAQAVLRFCGLWARGGTDKAHHRLSRVMIEITPSEMMQ